MNFIPKSLDKEYVDNLMIDAGFTPSESGRGYEIKLHKGRRLHAIISGGTYINVHQDNRNHKTIGETHDTYTPIAVEKLKKLDRYYNSFFKCLMKKPDSILSEIKHALYKPVKIGKKNLCMACGERITGEVVYSPIRKGNVHLYC